MFTCGFGPGCRPSKLATDTVRIDSGTLETLAIQHPDDIACDDRWLAQAWAEEEAKRREAEEARKQAREEVARQLAAEAEEKARLRLEREAEAAAAADSGMACRSARGRELEQMPGDYLPDQPRYQIYTIEEEDSLVSISLEIGGFQSDTKSSENEVGSSIRDASEHTETHEQSTKADLQESSPESGSGVTEGSKYKAALMYIKAHGFAGILSIRRKTQKSGPPKEGGEKARSGIKRLFMFNRAAGWAGA